jgi:hypothetical protein
VYTPNAPIARPIPVTGNVNVEGHRVMAAQSHPDAIGGSGGWSVLMAMGVLLLAAEVTRYALKRGYLRPLTDRLAPRGKKAPSKA